MFVILVKYKKPLEEVDKHRPEHMDFLEQACLSNFLLAAGPRNPRTGGVIVSTLTDRSQLEALIKKDPYYIHDLADYEWIEFTPTQCQQGFEQFL